jgi:hypothetical protein
MPPMVSLEVIYIKQKELKPLGPEYDLRPLDDPSGEIDVFIEPDKINNVLHKDTNNANAHTVLMVISAYNGLSHASLIELAHNEGISYRELKSALALLFRLGYIFESRLHHIYPA